MTFKLWALYLGVFIVFLMIDGIGHGVVEAGDVSDTNDTLAYQVDQISSGSGFVGLLRQSPAFLVTTLPKLITWNFGFLEGSLEIVRHIFIFFFGSLLITTVGGGFLGLLRRNV